MARGLRLAAAIIALLLLGGACKSTGPSCRDEGTRTDVSHPPEGTHSHKLPCDEGFIVHP